jgi:hypothetical protein
MPFGTGEEFVEGDDFGFAELSPVQFEGSDAVTVVAASLPT